MPDTKPENRPGLSAKKRFFFSLILVAASLAVCLAAAEIVLRVRSARIAGSDRMDPGLVQYDPKLGWKLTPGWTGSHRHHDFDVRYSINRYGFRGDFSREPKTGARRIAVVGDSFTFGLGAGDGEPFVAQMNRLSDAGDVFYNFGVLGYSTDQELLLVRERVVYFDPDLLLVVVYLGNDLFDNELAFPLQARQAKPFFVLTESGLALKNVPVPLETKPDSLAGKNLATVVLGRAPDPGVAERLLGRFELFRRFQAAAGGEQSVPGDFKDRFDSALLLFRALVEDFRAECEQRRIALQLALLPGRSYVERPRSPSARYQEHLRGEVVKIAEAEHIPVIDLAVRLRAAYEGNGRRLFFPHEGHLNPEGHRKVAKWLLAELPAERK